MKILQIKEYDSKFGYAIFIKDFSYKDYEKILRLIEFLGLDKDNEIEGTETRYIAGIYRSARVSLQFTYDPENDLFAATFKSDYLTADEFLSMFLSLD